LIWLVLESKRWSLTSPIYPESVYGEEEPINQSHEVSDGNSQSDCTGSQSSRTNDSQSNRSSSEASDASYAVPQHYHHSTQNEKMSYHRSSYHDGRSVREKRDNSGDPSRSRERLYESMTHSEDNSRRRAEKRNDHNRIDSSQRHRDLDFVSPESRFGLSSRSSHSSRNPSSVSGKRRRSGSDSRNASERKQRRTQSPDR